MFLFNFASFSIENQTNNQHRESQTLNQLFLNYNLLRLIILCLYIGLCALSSIGAPFSPEGERAEAEAERAFLMRDYGLLRSKGEELMRIGSLHPQTGEKLAGEALALNAMIGVRDTIDFTPRIEYLIEQAPSLKETDTHTYAIVSRTISSYYQKIINDYSQALNYASEALGAYRDLHDRIGETSMLSTISSIYFQKFDMTGWSYAVDSYNLARELDNPWLKYVAASNMANYLYNKKEYPEAKKYLDEAIESATTGHLDSEKSYYNSFMGDILYRQGKNREAEEYYILSLDNDSRSSAYDRVYSGICYAIFLMEQKRLDESLKVLSEARKLAETNKVTIFEKEIYLILSQIYEQQGDYDKSLENYKKYLDVTLHLYSEQKEREFAILDLRARVAGEQNKNSIQSMELLKRGKTIIILYSIGVVIIILCIAFLFYHRAKVRGYRETVARYLEKDRQEKLLRRQLDEANASLKEEPRSISVKEEKSDEIYRNLEELMTEKKIYRDPGLTLEKAAQMLATNRTYLSQVVNEKAGKSFSAYVNDFRLDEAVAFLSDRLNTAPLKAIATDAGFSSHSNFYTLFRQKVGVSPSVFRENVKSVSES